VLVGIGTLLNHRLPERLGPASRVVIFSSGVGYEKPLRALPPHWRISCVRGPLSAQALGLAPALAITDGALLLQRYWRPAAADRRWPAAFMPHIHHATMAAASWQQICQDLGWQYIDPRWPVEQVLRAIGQSQLLLAEAMHGAIAADALRVPWIAVQTSARILPFKWQDWCASVQVPFQPAYLWPLPAYRPVAQGLRSALRAGRYAGRVVAADPAGLLRWGQLATAAHLLKVSQTRPPQLSSDSHCRRLSERLETALEQLQATFLA
jgi:succinoglycan biosynthesis protein ExoV